MSQNGPDLASCATWDNWERFVLACLRLALAKLRQVDPLPEGENALNAKLLDCMRVAARELRPKANYPPIRAECPPLPLGPSEEASRRLKATPDFVWGYVDPSEPDPLRDAREFSIECKRLRHSSASWNYNESYVEDGIQRFLDVRKNYGLGVSSAAMIGYWQGMDPDQVLNRINEVAQKHQIPILTPSASGWGVRAVSALEHTFTRQFPTSPFRLNHFWIDLRDCYVSHPTGHERSETFRRAE